MKNDIANRNDIKLLVDTFYIKVQHDAMIGPIFTQIMHVNWDTHLPKMYDFWENILFHTQSYNGSPYPIHQHINSLHKLENKHFDTWIELFTATVDELFVGEKAEEIKMRANSIKQIFNAKLNYHNQIHTL